jgi:glycosyltransferase involved in cell wall biosynthesis
MKTPFFSIVIPTFNRSDLFPSAVQSILNQTFEDFEIVVSDNCSVDDTPQVAKQFADARFRYVKTPQHFTIGDSWEFARSQAVGKLIFMLSDDDALLPQALERFAYESRRYDADFLFCKTAYYRDLSYPGPDRNSIDCPPFSGASHVVQAEEFIRPLFLVRQKFDMHPSAFAFAKTTSDSVASRCGRFFRTNGVEYFAWPLAAVFAKQIIYIDAPVIICGRTAKSWGSNLVLANPGKKTIDKFIADVDHERKCAPLSNFTITNMIAEGVLLAQKLFPRELGKYEFDEPHYLRRTLTELRQRQGLGVDVSMEIDELLRYAAKYPALINEFNMTAGPENGDAKKETLARRIRATIGDLGVRSLRERIRAYRLAQKPESGLIHKGFRASGDYFGFADILGCTAFLGRYVPGAPYRTQSLYDSSQEPCSIS